MVLNQRRLRLLLEIFSLYYMILLCKENMLMKSDYTNSFS